MADYVRDAFDRAIPGPPILVLSRTMAECQSKAAVLGTYILKFPPTKNWRAIAAEKCDGGFGKVREALEEAQSFFPKWFGEIRKYNICRIRFGQNCIGNSGVKGQA